MCNIETNIGFDSGLGISGLLYKSVVAQGTIALACSLRVSCGQVQSDYAALQLCSVHCAVSIPKRAACCIVYTVFAHAAAGLCSAPKVHTPEEPVMPAHGRDYAAALGHCLIASIADEVEAVATGTNPSSLAAPQSLTSPDTLASP